MRANLPFNCLPRSTAVRGDRSAVAVHVADASGCPLRSVLCRRALGGYALTSAVGRH